MSHSREKGARSRESEHEHEHEHEHDSTTAHEGWRGLERAGEGWRGLKRVLPQCVGLFRCLSPIFRNSEFYRQLRRDLLEENPHRRLAKPTCKNLNF